MKENTKRKEIYFYKPVLQKYEKSTNSFKLIDNTNGELKNIFNRIKELSLDKKAQNNIYVKRDNNTYNYIAIDFSNDSYIYGQIICSANDIYPSLEEDGRLSPLKEKLPNGSNLAHITHFVIFLDDNIIGVEYNNTGCRPSSISNYINEKFKAEYMLSLNEAINSTTETKLNKTKLVKEIDLTLDKSSISKFQSEQGELFEALQATQNLAKNICDDDRFTISVRLKSRTGFKITEDIKNGLKSLVRKDENGNKLKEKIKIKSQSVDDENFEFDLVRQVLKATKVYVKVKDNMIVSDDMFEKIIDSYKKYR